MSRSTVERPRGSVRAPNDDSPRCSAESSASLGPAIAS